MIGMNWWHKLSDSHIFDFDSFEAFITVNVELSLYFSLLWDRAMCSCKCFAVVTFIVLELVDLFNDAYFVQKLFSTEEKVIKDNLVLRYSALVFVPVAFVLFVLESINIYMEVFKKHKWANADITSTPDHLAGGCAADSHCRLRSLESGPAHLLDSVCQGGICHSGSECSINRFDHLCMYETQRSSLSYIVCLCIQNCWLFVDLLLFSGNFHKTFMKHCIYS